VEEERARLARERDAESYQEWENKEREFNLQQAKLRSEIRIREGRPKPIDILYKNLTFGAPASKTAPLILPPTNKDAPEFDFRLKHPHSIFKGLSLQEMKELEKDINMYLEYDSSHNEFWQALLIVSQSNLKKKRRTRTKKESSNV